MAIRYVKDFEFPSAAGYTKSSPSKVTGQMFAKGGQAKAPKGVMVVIGVGKPAKAPLRKSEGSKQSEFNKSGYDRDALQSMMNDIAAADEAERIMRKPTPTPKTTAPKAKKPEKTSPYIPGTNIKPDADDMRRLEKGYGTPEPSAPAPSTPEENARTPAKKGGFMKKAKGGMAKHADEAMDRKLIKSMVKPSVLKKAKGGACYAEGGLKNSKIEDKIADAYDEEFGMWVRDHGSSFAEAKARIAADKMKQELMNPKPIKKAQGGMAQKVQMAKSNAIEASLKGQKKTPYAVGGPAMAKNAARPTGLGPVKLEPPRRAPAPPQAPVRPAPAVMAPPRPAPVMAPPRPEPAPSAPMMGGRGKALPPAPDGVMRRAKGGAAAASQSPLQRMGTAPAGLSLAKAKGVPVAPRAPMIAPPSMGQKGVGVNAKRPGGPDVGAIRSALAKRASQAMPDNAPSVMKKGGKVK